MRKFKVEIVVPEKTFYVGEIDSLTVETTNGQLGILAGHAPMVIALHPSIIIVKIDGKEMIAANGAGFITVHDDRTIILCQTMEWADDIDIKRLSRELENGKKRLKEAKNEIEYEYGLTTLERANARLKALQRRDKNIKK